MGPSKFIQLMGPQVTGAPRGGHLKKNAIHSANGAKGNRTGGPTLSKVNLKKTSKKLKWGPLKMHSTNGALANRDPSL